MALLTVMALFHSWPRLSLMAKAPTYVSLSHPQTCHHACAVACLGVTPARISRESIKSGNNSY